MQKVFMDEVTSCADSIKYCGERIATIMKLAAAFGDIDLTDVGSISGHYQTYSQTETVTLRLKEDAKNSKLPHAFARIFNMKFTKSQDYTKTAINYQGEVTIDGQRYLITIAGAVPDTCTVDYIEEAIPENEIVRTRKKAVINCTGSEPESLEAAQEVAF